VSGASIARSGDARVAAATAAWAVEVAILASWSSGDAVPSWAGAVAELLRDWSGQVGPDGWAAGQAGTARTPGVLDAPWRLGVLDGSCVPAAPLPTHPLLTWLRQRLGVRRCLACGRLGTRSLQPAHPMVSPARARTWRCTDRVGCRRRRTSREARR
jgi:hypothetical protein